MKYRLVIEADFEAENYADALNTTASVVGDVSNSGFGVVVTKAEFKERHAPTVAVRDTGVTRVGMEH